MYVLTEDLVVVVCLLNVYCLVWVQRGWCGSVQRVWCGYREAGVVQFRVLGVDKESLVQDYRVWCGYKAYCMGSESISMVSIQRAWCGYR